MYGPAGISNENSNQLMDAGKMLSSILTEVSKIRAAKKVCSRKAECCIGEKRSHVR